MGRDEDLFSHILNCRIEAFQAFFYSLFPHEKNLTGSSEWMKPKKAVQKCRLLQEMNKEERLSTLLFGSDQYPFLKEVVEPFSSPSLWKDLLEHTRVEGEDKLGVGKRKYTLWKAFHFRRAYLSTLSGRLPAPFSFLFDPKGRGENIPGLLLQEEIQYRKEKPLSIMWSASPTPFVGNKVVVEVDQLLSLWHKQRKGALWIYVNLQSLCHRSEKERSRTLLSFAQQYPEEMRVLQVTLDSPLYLSCPSYFSLHEQYEALLQDLRSEETMYPTSLTRMLREQWLEHAVDVATMAKLKVSEVDTPDQARVFMELFSLALARRWVGFSLSLSSGEGPVYLTQACKECLDRGATWLFEMALSLSSLSLRELQALFWGRSLLARGRLPEAKRAKGCHALFSALSPSSVGVWLQEQFELGLGSPVLQVGPLSLISKGTR